MGAVRKADERLVERFEKRMSLWSDEPQYEEIGERVSRKDLRNLVRLARAGLEKKQ